MGICSGTSTKWQLLYWNLDQIGIWKFSNEAGGEWPFAGGDNLGTQHPLRLKEQNNLMQDFIKLAATELFTGSESCCLLAEMEIPVSLWEEKYLSSNIIVACRREVNSEL